MIKIDELKEPPIVGEKYLVPCIVINKHERIHNIDWDDQDAWLDDKPRRVPTYTKEGIPVINHPHNDKENGQKEQHYHIDTRFIPNFADVFLGNNIRLEFKGEIENVPLVCKTTKYGYITDVKLISKSKLKHNCIYKGKCPHRGMDLSQVVPDENGIITCPLHSLKFDSKTKKLIK